MKSRDGELLPIGSSSGPLIYGGIMESNITLDKLMQKVDSRYTLVVVAAKRARKLTDNKENGSAVSKPVTEALKEISSGQIAYHRTIEGVK